MATMSSTLSSGLSHLQTARNRLHRQCHSVLWNLFSPLKNHNAWDWQVIANTMCKPRAKLQKSSSGCKQVPDSTWYGFMYKAPIRYQSLKRSYASNNNSQDYHRRTSHVAILHNELQLEMQHFTNSSKTQETVSVVNWPHLSPVHASESRHRQFQHPISARRHSHRDYKKIHPCSNENWIDYFQSNQWDYFPRYILLHIYWSKKVQLSLIHKQNLFLLCRPLL